MDLEFDSDIMDVRGAAGYLKVCTKTLLKLIAEQKIRVLAIGRVYRLRKKDLDDFVAANIGFVQARPAIRSRMPDPRATGSLIRRKGYG